MVERVYLDACCFVELAKGKFGKALVEDGKHLWYLQALLRASRAGKLEVFTSTISISECVTVGDGPPSPEVQQLFMGMLTSGRGGVLLVQPDLWVVERARDLRWKHEINLGSPDNIHVASALEAGCTEMVTLDGLSGKRKSILAAAERLKALGLRVAAPCDTALIPDAFRQEQMELREQQRASEAVQARAPDPQA